MDSLEAVPVQSHGDPRREPWGGFSAPLPGGAILSPQALVALCGTLLVLAVIAGALAAIYLLRDRELTQAERLVLEVNRTLADKTVFAIQGIDLVLRMTVERRGEEGAAADGLEVHRRLRDRIRLLTQARVLFVTDNQGRVLHNSRSSPPPRLNLADRDYFQRMRDADNLGVFVSRPDQDRVDPWRTFHFSRRLETADGRFDGVAVALADVDYTTAFYQGSGLPPEAVIRLVRNDGVEISRYPKGAQSSNEDPAAAPSPTVSPERFARARRSTDQVGNPLLVSAFPLSHYPLELEVSLPYRVALDGWRTAACAIALTAAIASLAIGYYIRKFVRHLAPYHAKSTALEESEERLDLVVQASKAGVFDCELPGGRLKPSPRFCELLGLPKPKQEMSLADFYGLIHPHDVDAARRAIEAHLATNAPLDADCRFRSAGGSVYADAGLARILLKNLLGNAWKFTQHCKEAAVVVGAETDVAGHRSFFVRDNGAGFDMSYSDKLFRPFQRLHTRDEFPGTGIGLATAQRIVHRHGGLIWAIAKPDAGATFHFTLDPTPQRPAS